MSHGEVLFEFVQVGQQMRVAAVDPATNTEVIVIAPVNASRHHMQQIALAKLRRKLGQVDPPPQPPKKYA
jgi:hypothetical protein